MQLYSTHVYEANSSLLLKSETSIVIYYVFPSSEHVLASSLELWLLRYCNLLHFALIVCWTNKSGASNRNRSPRSNQTLGSFSTMLLWSQDIFKRQLEPSASRETVIFHLSIFTRSKQYQIRSYLHCQPLNIVMSSTNTPSYIIQWHEDAANCNGNRRMWLLLVVFYTASVKINRKCQSITSFSINNGTMHTLQLT